MSCVFEEFASLSLQFKKIVGTLPNGTSRLHELLPFSTIAASSRRKHKKSAVPVVRFAMVLKGPPQLRRKLGEKQTKALDPHTFNENTREVMAISIRNWYLYCL